MLWQGENGPGRNVGKRRKTVENEPRVYFFFFLFFKHIYRWTVGGDIVFLVVGKTDRFIIIFGQGGRDQRHRTSKSTKVPGVK